METMDLSVIHKKQKEVMGVPSILKDNYESHVFKLKETYEETDVKGNNNLFNSLKTETNNDFDTEPSSLFQDETFENKKSKLGEETSLFNCPALKKAIDLRMHSHILEGKKRTIFEDAEYFAKNYSYKLLPITFVIVDERIIHSEHSYCHFSSNSESENEEDCSRTMDYTQIKEKNYKKRKAKFKQLDCENRSDGADGTEVRQCITETNLQNSTLEDESFSAEPKNQNAPQPQQEEISPAQPLDLSTPLVQEKKTDNCLRDKNIDENGDLEGKSEIEKENVKSKMRYIQVTITRPDEKENYQPCDLFLNDIAQLVPRLIEKDCSEIDILDRTCDDYVDVRKHRLYYIISKSTWGLFQSANERVILTNDQSLGQPALNMEGNERPTFLVFDQFSLAKCLADYCKEIGGCFEYTCVEDSESLQVEMEEKEEEEQKEEQREENKEEKEEKTVEEKRINETECEVEMEQEKQSTKNEVETKCENVKDGGEVENKSVDVEGHRCLTEARCCDNVNNVEKQNEKEKTNLLGISEKEIVEVVKEKKHDEGTGKNKNKVEIEKSDFIEESKDAFMNQKITSFEISTCSANDKIDVNRIDLRESRINLPEKNKSKRTEGVKRKRRTRKEKGKHCLEATDKNDDENNLRNKNVEKKSTENLTKRKRKRDVKEAKTDIDIKSTNIVYRVTTRSKSATAKSKKKGTSDTSQIDTSQNKDEHKIKTRKELKRKDPPLEGVLETNLIKEIPKRRKRSTSLQILTRESLFDSRTRSGKVINERKNKKRKNETEVLEQGDSERVKRGRKRKREGEGGQEGTKKTRKSAETTDSRQLRSGRETTERKKLVETRRRKRDVKNSVTEKRQKQKEKAVGLPLRRKNR